jgi:multicomponent K+:H+ antiporter subunit F
MSEVLSITCTLSLAGLLAAAGLCLYRMLIGPQAADRAIAFDTLSAIFVGIIAVLCIGWNSVLYFDAVWILTLVGFLGSASIARYLEKGRVF